MRKYKQLNYTQKIHLRIKMTYVLLVLMLIYMVIMGELGGDSRIMTNLANFISDCIFFGGIIYMIARIVHNKKLLKNRILLKEQLQNEQDERNQYIHDKSGGLAVDLLLIMELFVTMTTALLNMPAFYTSLVILLVTICTKICLYFFYTHYV
ncbi:MAG: hypothetical protein SO415_00995 [Oliverpabstia sp.]|nr:hypothetical protein [Oliverpabstia sp.]